MLKVKKTYKTVEYITRQYMSRVNKSIYSAQAFTSLKYKFYLLSGLDNYLNKKSSGESCSAYI